MIKTLNPGLVLHTHTELLYIGASAEMPKNADVKSKIPDFNELNLASNQMKIYHKVG